jgi:hypothetical protein
MADDTMEISSDHGHNGDDDIDIDIDFTTGEGDEIGDEDYMVDEAPVNTGFGNSFEPSSGQNDFTIEDVAMFDETTGGELKADDGSVVDVTISLEDGTFAEHPAHSDLPDSSFMMGGTTDLRLGLGVDEYMSAADLLNNPADNHLIQTSFDQDATFGKAPDGFAEGYDSALLDNSAQPPSLHSLSSKVEVNTQGSNPQLTNQPHDINSAGKIDAPGTEDPHHPPSVHDEPVSPAIHEQPNLEQPIPEQSVDTVETARVKSPTASTEEHQSSNFTAEGEGVVKDEHSNSVEAPSSPPTSVHAQNPPTEVLDSKEDIANTDVIKDNYTTTGPEVIIAWQSNEYSLFPKSESDNPDSFFLSDLEIIERPLSEFLQSIRSVISEELQDEDELCMAVGDLGLEFEEVCQLR